MHLGVFRIGFSKFIVHASPSTTLSCNYEPAWNIGMPSHLAPKFGSCSMKSKLVFINTLQEHCFQIMLLKYWTYS